jgi:hypothetical protein
MRTVITLEIEHKGEIADLPDKAAGRVYTLQGVSNCTAIEPEVVVFMQPRRGFWSWLWRTQA